MTSSPVKSLRNALLSLFGLCGSFAVIAFLVTSGCGQEKPQPPAKPSSITVEGATMGTHYTVKLRHPPTNVLDRARKNIGKICSAIDNMMSTYKPDSELSRFNQFQSTEPFKVSPEMIEIFQAARNVSESTNGAFDITVGPIVNAWGFGPEKIAASPTDAEIAAILPRVGYKMVSIDAATSTIRKERPDIVCDLSGIGQGYAADKIAEMLDQHGIQGYMIDISGEFRTRGVNDTGEPWQIGIERPDAPERTAQLVVPLSSMSLATSGDYRNYREENGVRVSHEIDPATGHPIQHKLASATIVIDRCAFADAYATALMVLGPEKALALANEKGLAVYLLVRNDVGGFDELESAKFTEWKTKK